MLKTIRGIILRQRDACSIVFTANIALLNALLDTLHVKHATPHGTPCRASRSAYQSTFLRQSGRLLLHIGRTTVVVIIRTAAIERAPSIWHTVTWRLLLQPHSWAGEWIRPHWGFRGLHHGVLARWLLATTCLPLIILLSIAPLAPVFSGTWTLTLFNDGTRWVIWSWQHNYFVHDANRVSFRSYTICCPAASRSLGCSKTWSFGCGSSCQRATWGYICSQVSHWSSFLGLLHRGTLLVSVLTPTSLWALARKESAFFSSIVSFVTLVKFVGSRERNLRVLRRVEWSAAMGLLHLIQHRALIFIGIVSNALLFLLNQLTCLATLIACIRSCWLDLPLTEIGPAFILIRGARVGPHTLDRPFVIWRYFFSLATLASLVIGSVAFLLVSIKIVEEQVIVLNFVVQVVDYFLFFVDLYAKASLVIEHVFFVLLVYLATQAASPRQYQLSLRFLSIFYGPLNWYHSLLSCEVQPVSVSWVNPRLSPCIFCQSTRGMITLIVCLFS